MCDCPAILQDGVTMPVAATTSYGNAGSGRLRALGLAAWIVLLLVPFWSQADWKARRDNWESSADRPVQMVAFVLAGLAQVAAGPQLILRGIKHFLMQLPGCLWSIAFVNILVLSLFSIRPLESAIYACLTATAFLISAVAWENNRRPVSQWLGRAAWLICAFMGILCLRLGWNGITIGGIQHNQVAITFFTALVCFQFLSRGWRIVGTSLALAVIVCASSRSALLTAVVFLALILLLRPWTRRVLIWPALGTASIAFLIAIDLLLQTNVAWACLDSTLSLSDSARGLESGFTGRTALWRDGWAAFLDQPIIGYGFRTRTRLVEDLVRSEEVNAHNGYLNLVLDVGLLGAVPVLGAVAYSASQYFGQLAFTYSHASEFSDAEREQERKLCRTAIALIGASLVGWVFEPAYLNLGASHTVLLIVILAIPTYMAGRLPLNGNATVARGGVPC